MSDILTPVELNDDELLAVSGGVDITAVAVGVSQRISQEAAVVQEGGSVHVGGGNGATTFTGNLTFSETFNGSIGQGASNSNSGSVTATVTASS
jgi:hypothetical protein